MLTVNTRRYGTSSFGPSAEPYTAEKVHINLTGVGDEPLTAYLDAEDLEKPYLCMLRGTTTVYLPLIPVDDGRASHIRMHVNGVDYAVAREL